MEQFTFVMFDEGTVAGHAVNMNSLNAPNCHSHSAGQPPAGT